MSARHDLFERLDAFARAARDPALQVRPPSEVEHNGAARLLRNGLAVAGFALLEDFIKRRTGEILRSLTPPTLRFNDLPAKIQEAATVGALASAAFQARLRRRAGEDAVPYVQALARDVASTSTSAFQLSEFAFGYAQSNLNHEDVKTILGAFGVESCWSQIRDLAARAGLGGSVSYEQVFQNATRMRHAAAHDSSADTAVADLEAFARNATAIAVGFDLLIAKAGRLARMRDQPFLSGLQKVHAADIRIRFIDPAGDLWREWVEGKQRAAHRGVDSTVLMTAAVSRAKARREAVIQRGGNLTPHRWYPTDDV